MKYPYKINCKEASYLISKKQEGSISITDTLKLKIHLGICSTCKLFQMQTALILNLLKSKPKNSFTLNSNKKAEIKLELENEMKNS